MIFIKTFLVLPKDLLRKNLLNGGFIGIDIVSQMASVYLDEVMKGVSDGTINVAEAIKAIPLDRIKGDDIFAKIDTLKKQVENTINDFKKVFELGKSGNLQWLFRYC
jgi:ACT domain-containing protein